MSLAFGGLQAVEQVSFGVAPGAVKAVIGPNGAGKTTLFNLVTGFLAPQAGRILFGGVAIQGRPAHRIARQGIARTFQLVQLFDHMTVLENVMVGRHRLSNSGLIAGALQFSWTRMEEQVIREKAMEALEFVGLADRARQPAAVLPLGLKRMLEIARAKAQSRFQKKRIDFTYGDVSKLPYPESHFDCVGISFAFRNLTYKNPKAKLYLAEILRVLKPGGKFVIVESSQPGPALIRSKFHLYLRAFVFPVGYLLSGNKGAYRYLAESAARFYSPKELSELLARAGFSAVRYRQLFFGAAGLYTALKP